MSIKSLTILACLATATLVGFTPTQIHAADLDRTVVGLKFEGPINVVYQITSDDMKEGVNEGLFYLKRVHQQYVDAGVDASRLDIKAVFHSDASTSILTDKAWNKYQQTTGGNPNTALIEELIANGIDIEFCNSRRISMKWEKSDIHSEVILVGGAYTRLTDLQLLGYAYIKF